VKLEPFHYRHLIITLPTQTEIIFFAYTKFETFSLRNRIFLNKNRQFVVNVRNRMRLPYFYIFSKLIFELRMFVLKLLYVALNGYVLSKHFRVIFAGLNKELTMPKLRVFEVLV